MLTPFGKTVRKLRIDRGVRLKDMAAALDVSSAFLSASETGKKNPTPVLATKVAEYFKLNESDKSNLLDLVDQSKADISLHISGLSNSHRETAVALARRFSDLDEDDLNRLKEILKQHGGT